MTSSFDSTNQEVNTMLAVWLHIAVSAGALPHGADCVFSTSSDCNGGDVSWKVRLGLGRDGAIRFLR
jgi:hypothetical protein